MSEGNKSVYLQDNSLSIDSSIGKNLKLETNLFTNHITQQATADTHLKNASLSDIILNYQDFWQEKISKQEKENSLSSNLQINSIIADNHFPNDNFKNPFEKKKPHSSLLCIESKKSVLSCEELGLATQVHENSFSTGKDPATKREPSKFKINSLEPRGEKIEDILIKVKLL